MSEPQRISDLVNPSVTVTCGCGTEYDSPAITLGERVMPTRLYCMACSTKRSLDMQKQEEARRVAVAQRTRERAALELEAERRRRDEAIATAKGDLAVPKLYEHVTLDSYQLHGTPAEQGVQRTALQFARQYVAGFPAVPMLSVFTGSPGSGKGHVAWSLAKEIVAGGKRAQVVKLGDLVRELRASWGKGADDGLTLLHFRRLDLLVVDEVSRHAFYGQPVQHLYDVLDHRVEQQRPTILTSNETDEGLRQILSPALWNRIEGHGGVVDFGTASWRSRR